jgi:flagellar hook-associated protein 1 FlgK
MLQTQRDSVSGVSLDEEMTNLMQYQKTYEASAQLVSTINQMLETVINMKTS